MNENRRAPIPRGVEVTARYATVVEDLAAAWGFIMERVDRVGPNPSIAIDPLWLISDTDDRSARQFTVVVSGMVEEGGDA